MKKNAILPLVAAMMLPGLASCEIEVGFELANSVNIETSETSDDAWTAFDDGITVVSSGSYTVSELFALYSASYLGTMSESEKAVMQQGFEAFCTTSISDYDIPTSDEKYWEVASVTYNYEGKTLPGSLIYCTHGASHTPISPRYIVVDNHWTMTGANEFPSKGASPVIALARMDAVYICPDQMAEGEAQPYLCEEITAKRTIAMVKAALGFLKDKDMAPLKICEGYSIGYSQGGASALALQRAIEQDEALSEAIGFAGTYSGAGPYSMTTTLEEWAKADEVAFPAAIGLIALAWDSYYADELGANTAADKFLSDKFRASGALADIASRSANIGTINAKIKASFGPTPLTTANLLASDWDTNDAYKFKSIAESNDLLTGWTPKHPIVFFHSTEDEVVPYANTEKAIEAFGTEITTLHKQTGNHSDVGVKFYTWLGLQKGFPMSK